MKFLISFITLGLFNLLFAKILSFIICADIYEAVSLIREKFSCIWI